MNNSNPDSQQQKPTYVTVLLIPIVGGNGNIQSRSVVFNKSPTKEHAIAVLNRIHDESCFRSEYLGEWRRCVDTIQQVPEELFAMMNQRRARNITHLVKIKTPDGAINSRLFSARSCFVHSVDQPSG